MAHISFVSTVEYLDSIEECLPQPAKKFIPEWFKNMPRGLGNDSIKKCPSFPDYFSLGFVLPMWSDVHLRLDINENQESASWDAPSNKFHWEMHQNFQFIDYATPRLNGDEGHFVFKADCPWKIITPKGWSVLQLPLFYHFNKEWSVMPGIIDTDIHHVVNQQVLYHSNEKEITIKRGEPFVLYIPFKREDHTFDVRYQTEKDKDTFAKGRFNLNTKLVGSGVYRAMQRKRDEIK